MLLELAHITLSRVLSWNLDISEHTYPARHDQIHISYLQTGEGTLGVRFLLRFRLVNDAQFNK